VDVPALWAGHARDRHEVVDGGVVTRSGVRIGLVGGGLRTPYRTPFEISDEQYLAKVEALGPVDVLCTHIPPAVPDSCYDVVARRLERGSRALLEYIGDVKPAYALHGHVHQPLADRVTIGPTQVLNVGHFRATGRPFALDLD
jgi:Icc-related predicted phosphoesterase